MTQEEIQVLKNERLAYFEKRSKAIQEKFSAIQDKWSDLYANEEDPAKQAKIQLEWDAALLIAETTHDEEVEALAQEEQAEVDNDHKQSEETLEKEAKEDEAKSLAKLKERKINKDLKFAHLDKLAEENAPKFVPQPEVNPLIQELQEKYTVKELKAIIKKAGFKGYSKLKELELIQFIIDNAIIL